MNLALVLLAAGLAHAAPAPAVDNPALRASGAEELARLGARFVPTEIRADLSRLSAGDRRALELLVEASRKVDELYLRQAWSENPALLAELSKDRTPLGEAQRRYFWINKGPWSSLDGFAAFLAKVPNRKPLGADFYPSGMGKEEFESWVRDLPVAEQEKAKGFFTVIRRGPDGRLAAVPYSRAYAAELQELARLLRAAAEATDNASLKKFLSLRADAFLSDDYYASDLAWMDLDAPLEPTIGPYETYLDELFGYKAAFESYVAVRDDAETARLASVSKRLQEIEDHLPIPKKLRNPKLGALAPIRVVNEVVSAGDANHGVQPAAFNLPNDERVISQKGSKRVMLKNVQEAKFKSVLLPIAARVLAPEARADADFGAFFWHILAHELCHGLGPHQITVAGRATTPRAELKDLHGAVEEAKADAVGLFALRYLMDHGGRALGLESGRAAERRLYATFLASAFRTLRFGAAEAHGRGMALQLNYLLDKGAFRARPDGTFEVDLSKAGDAVRDLSRELLLLEARGDREAASRLLNSLAVVRPEVQRALDRLQDLPVDIQPAFATAGPGGNQP